MREIARLQRAKTTCCPVCVVVNLKKSFPAIALSRPPVYHEIPLLLLKLTEVPLLLIRDFAGSQNADIRGGAPAETGAAGAAAGAAGAAMAQAVDTEAGPPVDAATGAPGAATGAAGAAISEPVMPVSLPTRGERGERREGVRHMLRIPSHPRESLPANRRLTASCCWRHPHIPHHHGERGERGGRQAGTCCKSAAIRSTRPIPEPCNAGRPVDGFLSGWYSRYVDWRQGSREFCFRG